MSNSDEADWWSGADPDIELEFDQKRARGLEDLKAGRVKSADELEARMAALFTKRPSAGSKPTR